MYDYFLCYIVDDFQQVQPNGGQTETVFDKLVSRVSESHELTTCSSDQRVPKTADDVEFPDPVNPGGALDNTSSVWQLLTYYFICTAQTAQCTKANDFERSISNS